MAKDKEFRVISGLKLKSQQFYSSLGCHSEVQIPTLPQEKDKVATCPLGLGPWAAGDGKMMGHCGTRQRQASGKGEPHPLFLPIVTALRAFVS